MIMDISQPGLETAPAELRLVDSAQMRRIEQVADGAGHSYAEMMAQAGKAVAEVVAEQVLPGGGVLVLVGPGNNGGDGLVAALELGRLGYAVQAVSWGRKDGDELMVRARAAGLDIMVWNESSATVILKRLAKTDAVVDALLGTGVSRPLDSDVAALLDGVMKEVDPLLVVAVDVPTGLNVDTGAVDPHTPHADITVTFGLPKLGQFLIPGAARCGRLLLDDIGLREEWVASALAGDPRTDLVTRSGAEHLLPGRPLGGHKGTFGKVLIVAGSTSYAGAAFLAGLAAYRAGAGLVTIALPAHIHGVVAGLLPEATFVLLPDVDGAIAAAAAPILRAMWEDYDAVLVGPGLGRSAATEEFLAALFSAGPAEGTSAPAGPWPPRLVVDADGLNLLAGLGRGPAGFPPGTILTPHPGEMGRLLSFSADAVNADRVGIARSAAIRWGQVVVLKGAYTLIASPDGAVGVNPFATPLLATAGSGDVLAGAIAGLLAQGAAPQDAARLGAYLHAYSALLHPDAAAGRGRLAREIADGLPRAVRALMADGRSSSRAEMGGTP